MQTLVASVQRLSGRKLPIGNTKTLEEEAQELRNQLEDLTGEVCLIYSSYAPFHCLHRMWRRRPAVVIAIVRKAPLYTLETIRRLCLHPHRHRHQNRKPIRVPNLGMRHVDSILTYFVRDRYDLPQMINGLLQRLTQKEKEVTQLRGEIDRLKIQNSGEAYDPVSRPISTRYWIGK